GIVDQHADAGHGSPLGWREADREGARAAGYGRAWGDGHLPGGGRGGGDEGRRGRDGEPEKSAQRPMNPRHGVPLRSRRYQPAGSAAARFGPSSPSIAKRRKCRRLSSTSVESNGAGGAAVVSWRARCTTTVRE